MRTIIDYFRNLYLWERFKIWCWHRAGYVTDEEELIDDMVKMYEKDPNWDRDSLKAAVKSFLKRGGWKRETLVAIYSEEIVCEVEQELAKKLQ